MQWFWLRKPVRKNTRKFRELTSRSFSPLRQVALFFCLCRAAMASPIAQLCRDPLPQLELSAEQRAQLLIAGIRERAGGRGWLQRSCIVVRPQVPYTITTTQLEGGLIALMKRFDRGVLKFMLDAPAPARGLPSSPLAMGALAMGGPGSPNGSGCVCLNCGERFTSGQGLGSHRRWCTGVPGDAKAVCRFCKRTYHLNGLKPWTLHICTCAQAPVPNARKVVRRAQPWAAQTTFYKGQPPEHRRRVCGIRRRRFVSVCTACLHTYELFRPFW